jgi:hypothetical protein
VSLIYANFGAQGNDMCTPIYSFFSTDHHTCLFFYIFYALGTHVYVCCKKQIFFAIFNVFLNQARAKSIETLIVAVVGSIQLKISPQDEGRQALNYVLKCTVLQILGHLDPNF